MTTPHRAVSTIGELQDAISHIRRDLDVGISYSNDDGIGETLVVTDEANNEIVLWIGMDLVATEEYEDET
jgi:hypothetical protein